MMSFRADRTESGRGREPEQRIKIFISFYLYDTAHYFISGCEHSTGQYSYKVIEQKQAPQRKPLFRNQMQQMRFSLWAKNCKSEIIGGADIV